MVRGIWARFNHSDRTEAQALWEVCHFCVTIPVLRCQVCRLCHNADVDSAQLIEKARQDRVFGLQVRLPHESIISSARGTVAPWLNVGHDRDVNPSHV